jgi:Ca2+-binding EF-hand superfamily protein
MFNRIDLDGNGTLDYTEFVTATINEKNLIT